MKKFFTFAIVLVASVLSFTGCQPTIDHPLVGSWRHSGAILVVDNQEYYVSNSLNFFDNGQYQRNIYIDGTFDGWSDRGEWSVKGDKLTIYTQKAGTIKNNNFSYSSTNIEEVVTWRIEGHYLYLTYENGDEERFYDGSGQF